MEKIKIQQARSTDHTLLTQITFEGKAFWKYSQEDLIRWQKDLTITAEYINANKIYKLVLNDEIIGYYSYLQINELEIKLDYLFISPTYIGSGYGNVLMLDFLAKAQLGKFQIVILEADPNVENFYKKFGFVTYDQKESSIKNRFLPLMKLDLIKNPYPILDKHQS